ncbi:MAG: hypothetical protein AB8H03_01955 [Saprospiraceae bacterium]
MAKKRKKTKKKSSNSGKSLSMANYIKQAARKLKILECLAMPDWEESGITQIIVARQKPNGAVLAGFYVVDIFCLGIKNTMFQLFGLEDDYRDFIDMNLSENGGMIEIEPQLAFNLIYGAREYAEDLGFDPHQDFKLTEYILPDVEDVEYMDIEFGKDGKPFYMSGPFDNVDKILNTLSKNVGAGNFEYATHVEDDLFEAMEESDFRLSQKIPLEIISAKSKKMNEENQMAYEIQVFIADGILKEVEGDFDALIDEPAFFEEMVETVIYNLEKSELFTEIEDADARKFMERNVVFILEKMIEHQSIGFLLEEDYEPVPRMLSEKEYEKMTEAEYRIYSKKVSNTMTKRENGDFLLERTFFIFIQQDIENGKDVPSSIEDADDYFQEKMKILGEVEDGEKEILREYFNKALESFLRMDD